MIRLADEENILGGKLSLEDNYSSALSRFADRILGAENRFKQFADKVIGSNNKIGANLSKSQKEVDKFSQRFIQQGNSVSDAINKANEKVKQNQEKTIEGLTKKYLKLGMTIQDAYSKAKQESNHIWNGDSKPTGSNDGIKDFAQNILSGGFSGMLSKLGLIGTGVMATVGVLKKIDGAMDTGFNTLNKLSGNMFSYEGIKQSLGTAMDYQSTRAKLDLFYGNEQEGENAYKLASKVALDTFADPKSLADAMSIMKKNNVDTNEKDLYTFLDMVGSRGEGTTAKEVGLAIEDAMNGEWERLKEYSITTTKLKKYLEELKKTDKATYKELKNTFNKQGTVTDPQKAYKLIMDYVRSSPINGYAEQYAKNAQGSLQNLTGLWEQIKVSIMGLDDAGKVVKGSAIFEFAEMVNNLKDTLGSDSATKGFGEISKGLGEGFRAFGDAFNDVLEKTDWEKVGKAIADSIGVISDSLINLSESGVLKELSENLPKIIDTLLNNKIIESNTKVQIATDTANGKWYNIPGDYISGKVNKVANVIDSDYVKSLNSTNWINDRQIIQLIRESDISSEQKKDLKGLVTGDKTATYNIHIEKIDANNFDEIMESIKQIQANRR
nr:MAG TPA: hypothetical protein [Caudoviricetes sp.]